MQVNMYEEMAKMSYILQNSLSEEEAVDLLLDELKKLLKVNVVIIDDEGRILGEKLLGSYNILNKSNVDGKSVINPKLNEQFLEITRLKDNISLNSLYIKDATRSETSKYIGIISPIAALTERLGTLVIYKEIGRFDRISIMAVEYTVMILGLIIKSKRNAEDDDNIRKRNTVKSAIGTLTYSELEAVIYIFEEMTDEEGIIVASKIADRVGITRSVIVNALRKCESAGVIESHSLGMKGTYIKILNEYLTKELNKLRK